MGQLLTCHGSFLNADIRAAVKRLFEFVDPEKRADESEDDPQEAHYDGGGRSEFVHVGQDATFATPHCPGLLKVAHLIEVCGFLELIGLKLQPEGQGRFRFFSRGVTHGVCRRRKVCTFRFPTLPVARLRFRVFPVRFLLIGAAALLAPPAARSGTPLQKLNHILLCPRIVLILSPHLQACAGVVHSLREARH